MSEMKKELMRYLVSYSAYYEESEYYDSEAKHKEDCQVKAIVIVWNKITSVEELRKLDQFIKEEILPRPYGSEYRDYFYQYNNIQAFSPIETVEYNEKLIGQYENF